MVNMHFWVDHDDTSRINVEKFPLIYGKHASKRLHLLLTSS